MRSAIRSSLNQTAERLRSNRRSPTRCPHRFWIEVENGKEVGVGKEIGLHCTDTDGDGISDWEEEQVGRNPCDPSDGNTSKIPVFFIFGDPSNTHSEMYRVVVSPKVGSGFGTLPAKFELDNSGCGVLNTKFALLERGWSYDVWLEHIGSMFEKGEEDFDYVIGAFASSPKIKIDDPAELFGCNILVEKTKIFEARWKMATITVEPDIKVELTIDGGKEGVILMHGAITNYPGNVIDATSTMARVVARYDGNVSGRMKFDVVCKGSAKVSVFADDVELSSSFSWPVSTSNVMEFSICGIKASSFVDDVELICRFVRDDDNNDDDDVVVVECDSSQVGLTVVEVCVWAYANYPGNKKRLIFGPGEKFDLYVSPRVNVQVQCDEFNYCRTSRSFALSAPNVPLRCFMNVSRNSATMEIPIEVFAPCGIQCDRFAFATNHSDWSSRGVVEPKVGEQGGGLLSYCYLLPVNYVSFRALYVFEGVADAEDKKGCFEKMATEDASHGVKAGALVASQVLPQNLLDGDLAGGVATNSPPWFNGSALWSISNYWYVASAGQENNYQCQTNFYCVVEQRMRFASNGDTYVSKYGNTIMRGTNDAYTIVK